MASRYRKKGSYKEFLNLTAEDISKFSEAELRAVVSVLNDVANKRAQRLENAGLAEFSPSYRARFTSGKGKFRLPTEDELRIVGKSREGKPLKEHMITALKREYLSVRQFLKHESTTMGGVMEEVEKFGDILSTAINESIFDERYNDFRLKKGKRFKKKVRAFWAEYDKWRETLKKKGGDIGGSTNLENVEDFVEELYSQGKTSLQDYERKAQELYEKKEERRLEDEEGVSISSKSSYGRGTQKPKQKKQQRRGSIRTKFEKIKIF